jgi:hypothetical protein
METVRAAYREPLRMSQAEAKVPGGKLVRLKREKSGTQTRVQVSGDFFIHPEDGVQYIEQMLGMLPETLPESAVKTAIEVLITFKEFELIGIDSGTIARLFVECCRCGE